MPFKNNVLTVLDQYNAYLNKIITFLQTPYLCFFFKCAFNISFHIPLGINSPD